jgi:hypothetical protein
MEVSIQVLTAGTNLGTFGSSDIISIAYNADDNELTFYKNGISAGTESIVDNEYYPDFGAGTSVASTVNFGQDSTFAGATTAGGNSDENGYGDFKYAVPSGFLALNSANLPEPSITPLDDDVPEDYFDTVTYMDRKWQVLKVYYWNMNFHQILFG